MKLIKTSWLAGLGVATALALTPAFGFAQSVTTTTRTYEPSVTTRTYTAPAPSVSSTRTTVSRSWEVNPNDPVQFPPASVGMNPDSHQGKVKAAYVDHRIALAKARGIDTSAAEVQEVQGQADLKHGLNTEAAQHFDAALRSIDVMPAQPEQNPGEAGSLHNTMP